MRQSQKGLSCTCGKPAFSKGLCKACWGAKYRFENRAAVHKGQEAWRNSHPLYAKNWSREKHSKCSPEQYQQAWIAQQGCCALCGLPMSEEKYQKGGMRGHHVTADHNHLTGEFRALIHNRCNIALGTFHDSIAELERAIAYLKKFL